MDYCGICGEKKESVKWYDKTIISPGSKTLDIYKEKYTEDKEHFNKVIDSLKDTPQSNQLVTNFINRVLLC